MISVVSSQHYSKVGRECDCVVVKVCTFVQLRKLRSADPGVSGGGESKKSKKCIVFIKCVMCKVCFEF